MLFTIIDGWFDALSGVIKIPDDQLKLVFCLISSYPVGFIYKRISSITLRYTLSLLLGLFYLYLVFHNDILHIAALATISYCLMAFGKRDSA